jgi:WS/DGAT/MGAT family acyltransferase
MGNSSHSEPMSAVDRAWLGMDSEFNLMIINGVMLFDDVIEYDRFLSVWEDRLLAQYSRFRQRIVEKPRGSGRYVWEDDPYFDIRAHVHRIALPAPGDARALQRLISDLMSTDLDHHKPLWRAYLIENVEGGCAVFSRFHHCIADGIALIRVILSMTVKENEADFDFMTLEVENEAIESNGGFNPLGPIKPVARLAKSTIGGATKAATALIHEGFQAVSDPGAAFDAAKALGIITAASAAVLTRLIVIPPDRESVFRGELGPMKRVVWSESVDLAEVKRIGKTFGGTVNDVLIAALTGALRSYMLYRDDDPDNGDIRSMVPVNLRPLEGDIELGNRFGLVYLTLPVSLADPLERLYEVRRRMNILKSSPEAILVYQVLSLLGRLPGDLAEQATSLFASKATAVLTNVPGPQYTLYFAGKPMRRIMFWVPQSGDIGLGLSIISYNGEVTLGLVIDEKLASDPEIIMESFMEEFIILGKLADARREVAAQT